MESHISRRARILEVAKEVIIRSPHQDEDLLEKILIHIELLSSKDVVLNKDFYSILQARVRSMPEMVDAVQRREQIECVQINKKTVCPISQKEIVAPYVGKCGHVLETKEALRYLRNNPRAKCPHVGCNREFVRNKR